MGFPTLASLVDNPVYWNGFLKKFFPSSVFSFWLSPNLNANGGELYLDGFNANRFTGSITWLSLTSAVYWSVRLDSVTMGNSTTTTLTGVGSRAILDTGTSLIIGPSTPITAIHNNLRATFNASYGLFQVACSRFSTFPNVTFRLAGNDFVIGPNEYILRFNGLCFTGFSPGAFTNNEGLTTWILGDVFLRPWYSIHDMSGRRIGLAKSR